MQPCSFYKYASQTPRATAVSTALPPATSIGKCRPPLRYLLARYLSCLHTVTAITLRMASSSPTSPRWRVFRHLESLRTARVAADPPIWTEKVVDAQGNPATSPAPAAQDSLVVPIGDIGFASWHKPGLQNAQSYTATITQRIQYSGAGPEVPLVSTKTFKTPSTQWTLNPALVDSVYPPQGHGDSSSADQPSFYSILDCMRNVC